MKIIRVDKIPTGYVFIKSEPLLEQEIEDLIKLSADEIRYWYGFAEYEGSGQMLLFIKGKWYHHDMGHCSCYGPTCKMKLSDGYDTLNDLMQSCTEELRKELQPLIDVEA